MRLLYLLLLVLLPGSALAGGTYWTVSIEKFERTSERSAILTLRTREGERRDEFARCRPLVVVAEYVGEPGRKTSWSALVTVEKHREALDFIEDRFRSNDVIHFGLMGQGLIASDSSRCRVISRGLLLDTGNVVLSFNDPA